MPLKSLSRFAKAVKRIPRKKKRKPRKLILTKKRVKLGRGARGKVWVPVLTQERLTERHQYWNKFTMTKEESLFKEMEEKFTRLDLKKKHNPGSTNLKSNNQFSSGRARPTIPYPSGSCHTIIAGESSTFCYKPNISK